MTYPVTWVRQEKYCALTGESKATILNRRKSGTWLDGVHWVTGPDRRVWINIHQAQEWVQFQTPGIRALKSGNTRQANNQ